MVCIADNTTYANAVLGSITVDPHIVVDPELKAYFSSIAPASTPDEYISPTMVNKIAQIRWKLALAYNKLGQIDLR